MPAWQVLHTIFVHFIDHILKLRLCGILTNHSHHGAKLERGNCAITIRIKQVKGSLKIWNRVRQLYIYSRTVLPLCVFVTCHCLFVLHLIWWQLSCHWSWCNISTALKSIISLLFYLFTRRISTPIKSRFCKIKKIVSSSLRRKMRVYLHTKRCNLSFISTVL